MRFIIRGLATRIREVKSIRPGARAKAEAKRGIVRAIRHNVHTFIRDSAD